VKPAVPSGDSLDRPGRIRLIAVFSGVQLFSLGIIGEYLARTHFRMMEQPPYVVEGATDSDASDGREGPG